MNDSQPPYNRNRVYWHSRRGMLELDLLLMPFAEQVFDSLSGAEQSLYVDLLAEEDQDLYNWLLERQAPEQARFEPLIERILAHRQKRT